MANVDKYNENRSRSARSQRNSARESKSSSLAQEKTIGKSLLSREEEYKRLNSELEKRTASLVQEAEAVINQQDSVFKTNAAASSLLSNVSTDDFLRDWDEEDVGIAAKQSTNLSMKPTYSKIGSSVNRGSRKGSALGSRSSKSVSSSTKEDPVLAQFDDLHIHSAVQEMEGKLDGADSIEIPDDVLPQAAQQMGAEAQIRFLKAKARVMQEEMERLSTELTEGNEENNKLSTRIKELEDERNKLSRSNATQQTQIDKLKKSSEEEKNKTEQLQTQLSAFKKELDEVKRSQKQQQATQSAADVRLNRALEEVEKYKLQLSKTKEQNKSSLEGDKQKIERLLAETKKLEKQKNELMTGFKKQLKLIDILKRQKMHIEAAKMLSFTEDEFVKALEWGN